VETRKAWRRQPPRGSSTLEAYHGPDTLYCAEVGGAIVIVAVVPNQHHRTVNDGVPANNPSIVDPALVRAPLPPRFKRRKTQFHPPRARNNRFLRHLNSFGEGAHTLGGKRSQPLVQSRPSNRGLLWASAQLRHRNKHETCAPRETKHMVLTTCCCAKMDTPHVS
jgi:hypothetical protein